MKVYIVKKWNDEDLAIIGAVYAKYEDAEEHALDLAEYGAFDRHADRWYHDDMQVLEIETRTVQ